MKTVLWQFTSALDSTPRWSHWLLPLVLLLCAIYLVWRRWPSIGGLIARRKEELNALGEPPPERKLGAWRRRSHDIHAGVRDLDRRILSVLVPVVALLMLAGSSLGSYFFGHRVGYRLGYVEGQWELTHDRYSYTDVLVVERHNDQEYRVQPARMRPFEVKTCEPVDWEAGQMMSVFNYQQRKGCKDVSLAGSYQFYSYRGKRMSFKKENIDND